MDVVIFGHDTPAGKTFDVVLLVAILLSILNVMLESVVSLQADYGGVILVVEWCLTVLFTFEYLLRIYSAPKRLSYIFSFLGIVDLVSIAPTYLSLFAPGSQALSTVRALRLLRVFRVLKLVDFLREAEELTTALRNSVRKIIVFLGAVVTMTVIMGSLMYLVEGQENGFTSIPRSVYWAVVTMTTVGYGDIAPHTVLGQFIATIVMILGYGIIAVPTGIVSADLVQGRIHKAALCEGCGASAHDKDADFCKHCGNPLGENS
ncbi:MAG: ion transporter [Myxococcales bacterium]|nr:ion transporter [Myxococcales bacterium]